MVLQSRNRSRKFPEHEQHESEQEEKEHRQSRFLDFDLRRCLAKLRQPLPEQPRPCALRNAEQRGENGNEETFELFARTLRGKHLRALFLEQRAFPARLGQLLHLKFLKFLALLQ